MEEAIWIEFIPVVVGLLLLVLAFFVGGILERRHYADIKRREAKYVNKPAISFAKKFPHEREIAHSALCVSSVVVSVDHFKRFLAGWRMFFGGEMKSFSSIIDRGRREALLRMKEQHPDADLYINCRIETASISKGESERIGCAEVLAYGTAIYYK